MYIFVSYLFLSHLWPFTCSCFTSRSCHPGSPFVEHRQLPSQGRSGDTGEGWFNGKTEAAESLPIKLVGHHHSMVCVFEVSFWWWHLRWHFFLVIHQHTMLILWENKTHEQNDVMHVVHVVGRFFVSRGCQGLWASEILRILSFISQETPTNTSKTCHLFHKFLEAFCGLKFHQNSCWSKFWWH